MISYQSENLLVKAISIPTPFLVGDVWAYYVESESEAALIDCGQKTDDGLLAIDTFFKKEQIDTKKITQIWLTHEHPDHYGAAKVLANRLSAKILALDASVLFLEQKESYEPFLGFFREHGISDEWIADFNRQQVWFHQFVDAFTPDCIVHDNQIIPLGNTKFKVHHKPGHAWGHALFECLDEPIIFGGDVLIKNISSNALIAFNQINGERIHSLKLLRESMKSTAEIGKIIYPGHGERIEEPLNIWQKHDVEHHKRKEKIKNLLSRPMTLLEITQALFPFAKNSKSAYLPISELVGFLDWLMETGEIERSAEVPYRFSRKN